MIVSLTAIRALFSRHAMEMYLTHIVLTERLSVSAGIIMPRKSKRYPELLPHFSCHNLRHTFCTRFCENERDLKVIQEIMGHADITTTMNVYNEATKEKKVASFANLEGKIRIS